MQAHIKSEITRESMRELGEAVLATNIYLEKKSEVLESCCDIMKKEEVLRELRSKLLWFDEKVKLPFRISFLLNNVIEKAYNRSGNVSMLLQLNQFLRDSSSTFLHINETSDIYYVHLIFNCLLLAPNAVVILK